METRRHILQQARKDLAELGYNHLSLESLAEKCGVTRGAVYHHFKNKQEVFREVVEQVSQEMGGTIHTWALSGPSQGAEGIEALMLGTRGFLTASQSLEYQRIILTDAPAVLGMEEWQKIDDENTTATLVQVFTQILGDAADAWALAQGFSGAMNQLSRWINGKKDIDRAYNTLEHMLSFCNKPT